MSNLWVEETAINLDKGYCFGESGQYETYTDSAGELFRSYQKEYGRCVSRVYVDTQAGAKAVGWVFEKTDHYEDIGEPFKRETWVTVFNAPTEVETKHTHHYHELKA